MDVFSIRSLDVSTGNPFGTVDISGSLHITLLQVEDKNGLKIILHKIHFGISF